MRSSEIRFSFCEKPCYEELKSLGKGSFAKVYQVRKDDKLYALKRIENYFIKDPKYSESIYREIEIMRKLQKNPHPNIVLLEDVFETKNSLELLLEYVPGGNLFEKLQEQQKQIPEYLAKKYVLDIVEAVKHLHSFSEPILHRDIKPENILLSKEGSAKLCDFGSANMIVSDHSRDSYVGTDPYMAPEMKLCLTHDQSLDLWCIGILIFELLTGNVPEFGDKNEKCEKNKVDIVFPDTVSLCAEDLIRRILVYDPNKRISLSEIKEHIWFAGENMSPHIDKLIINSKRLDQSEMLERLKIRNQNLKQKMNSVLEKIKPKSVFDESADDHYQPSNHEKILTKKAEKEASLFMEILNLESNLKEKEKKFLKEEEELKTLSQIDEQLNATLNLNKKSLEEKISKLEKELRPSSSQMSIESLRNLLKNLERIHEHAENIPRCSENRILSFKELDMEPAEIQVSEYLPKMKLKMIEDQRNALVELKCIRKRRVEMQHMLFVEERENDVYSSDMSTQQMLFVDRL